MIKSYSNDVIRAVWTKGFVAPMRDPATIRKDQCGAWIKWSDYGNRQSDNGWEVDHIVPESKGGTDHISNLRPLQWQNNACRGDGPLTCPVTARA